MTEDYAFMGLKCGIEIHQRLDTHKLFCNCSSSMAAEEPMIEVRRKLRAVAGELGEVDRAALHEYLRDREFLYLGFEGETCLVELDEEPPSPLNKEALDIALQIALMFHATIPDEIHVMRKTVVDGSNTSGFQRTSVVGLGGYMEGPRGRVAIPTICLEEEAAGIGGQKEGAVIYKLDRLGIPLVEIATGLLEGYTPQEVEEVARRIGMALRMTGKVQRGIGTIRQDVNVSIEGGARVEIKGFQEIGRLAELVRNEARRQASLIELSKELKSRNARVGEAVEVTDVFRTVRKGPIARQLKKGGIAVAIRLEGYSGLLSRKLVEGRTFGRELADHGKAYGLGGLIHTDEDLQSMGLVDQFAELAKRMNTSEGDALVVLAGPTEAVRRAAEAVRTRARIAVEGLPEETREPNPDCTTNYKRPLPGSSRMYPETDIPPIPVEADRLERLRQSLPEGPEEKVKRFTAMGLSRDLAEQVVRDPNLFLFEKITSTVDVDPKLVANTIVSSFRALRRKGVKVDSLTEQTLVEVFEQVSKGRVVKEDLETVLEELASGKDLFEVLSGREVMSEEELSRLVQTILDQKSDLIAERRERSFGPVMGEVMKRARGRIDGATVGRVVRKLLTERLSSLKR